MAKINLIFCLRIFTPYLRYLNHSNHFLSYFRCVPTSALVLHQDPLPGLVVRGRLGIGWAVVGRWMHWELRVENEVKRVCQQCQGGSWFSYIQVATTVTPETPTNKCIKNSYESNICTIYAIHWFLSNFVGFQVKIRASFIFHSLFI